MTKFEEEFKLNEKNFINYPLIELGTGDLRNPFTDGKKIIEHFKDWEPPKEKVVIPKFVADFIKVCKTKMSEKYFPEIFHNAYLGNYTTDINMFICSVHTMNDFVHAYIYGYEVEKEQLYYVFFPGLSDVPGETLYLTKDKNGAIDIQAYEKSAFTESEIKAIDKRYWAFRVPVEEDK